MPPTPLTGWDGKMFGMRGQSLLLIQRWGAEGRVWSDAEGGRGCCELSGQVIALTTLRAQPPRHHAEPSQGVLSPSQMRRKGTLRQDGRVE